VTIDGDGDQSRDFTYVANVVDATVRAADAPAASGEIVNVSAGAPVTVNEVAAAIGRVLDRPVERTFGPPRSGDIRASWADGSRAAQILGYRPTVELEDGLRRTVDFLLGG
jgi:UDP-glucose 4-epimerase